MSTTANAAPDAGLGIAQLAGNEVALGLANGRIDGQPPGETRPQSRVKTRGVRGRRPLRYETYQDLLADAENVARHGARLLGNWDASQVFGHIAQAVNLSIDGFPGAAPWWLRLIGGLFRRRVLRGPMPAGFNIPIPSAQEALTPQPVAVEAALADLRRAVARIQLDTERSRHPVFGELSLDEWDSLHLRHAELHMSFLVPRLPELAAAAPSRSG